MYIFVCVLHQSRRHRRTGEVPHTLYLTVFMHELAPTRIGPCCVGHIFVRKARSKRNAWWCCGWNGFAAGSRHAYNQNELHDFNASSERKARWRHRWSGFAVDSGQAYNQHEMHDFNATSRVGSQYAKRWATSNICGVALHVDIYRPLSMRHLLIHCCCRVMHPGLYALGILNT